MKPKKETEGKISYMEINPHFIAAMAKRMNDNTKYPLFNYKLQMDMEGLLQLVDATERHLADLKCLLQNEPPVHNLFETPLDHLPAIANNAAMIFYQLSKYEFGSDEVEGEETSNSNFYDKIYIENIFCRDNETNKSEREKFVSQCKGELYEHIKNLFGDDFQILCTDMNVHVSLTIGNHEAHAEYSMLDYEEQFFHFLPIDEKTAKEDNYIDDHKETW